MKYAVSMALLVAAVFTPQHVPAQERSLDFVRALRARRYYDTAIDYINQSQTDARISDQARATLRFEKAITLVEYSRTIRDFDRRTTTLDEAKGELEQFVKANPNHPLVPKASAEQASIFFERARTLTLQSRSTPNTSEKKSLQAEARKIIGQARDTFQRTFDLYKAKYESFPSFIEEKEKDKIAARREAENGYLTAKLNLARCRYEEGQTWDEEAKQRKDILTTASKEFSKIHDDHRSQFVGLFARMMQGKCFEEQGDITIALGLYNELIGHGGEKQGDTNPTLRKIRNQVIRFRLICLNHEKKRDYELAMVEGSEWLKNNTGLQRTPTGLGIRWEVARAQENLAKSRVKPSSAESTDLLLRKALDAARTINKYESEFKEPSAAMIRRIKVALGQKEGDPKDFDTAFELARTMIRQIGEKKSAVDQSKNAKERATAKETLTLHLTETGRLLRMALDLSDDKTEPSTLVQARYLLSFVYYEQKRSLESIILANHVMRFADDGDADTAMNSAEVALAACVQAYNQAGQQNDTEIRIMEQVASRIVEKWPSSENAHDARLKLGRLFSLRNEPTNAAKWYTSIPNSAPQYADAQMAAGQAYWAAYLPAAALPTSDDARPSMAVLNEWKESAERHLKQGIDIAGKSGSSPSDALTAARVSMCQIHNMAGRYPQTIQVLKDGPAAVLKSIAVPENQQRPAKGVKSRDFASLCYQLLLRAYVGTQQIDAALGAMQEMEALGGSNNTQIYVELGRELEKEIQRLKAADDQKRLAEVRNSFEQFLNELFKRREGQTYNSLIWIAETYFGLGQGMADSTGSAPAGQDATAYFSKAAEAYQDIIKRNLIEPDKQVGIKLRLVNCRRAQQKYASGLSLVQEVLKAKPKALDAHVEAAKLLQSQGMTGPNREPLLQAINGMNQGGVRIWGWAEIGQKLYAAIAAGQSQPEYRERYLDASYNAITCRHEYGKLSSNKPALDAAQNEVEVFASVAGDVDKVWWDKFDLLYQAIQMDRGIRPPDPLVVPESYEPASPKMLANVPTKDSEKEAVTTDPEAAPVAESQPFNPMMAGIALVLALAGAGGFFFMLKPKKRTRSYAAVAGDSVAAPPTAFDGGGGFSAGDLPDFSGLDTATAGAPAFAGLDVAPPAKPVRKKKTARPAADATGDQPRRKKKKVAKKAPRPAEATTAAPPVAQPARPVKKKKAKPPVAKAAPPPAAPPVAKPAPPPAAPPVAKPAPPVAKVVPPAEAPPVAQPAPPFPVAEPLIPPPQQVPPVAKPVQPMDDAERARQIAARKKAAIAARRKAEQQAQQGGQPPVAQPVQGQPVKKKVVKKKVVKKKRPPEPPAE